MKLLLLNETERKRLLQLVSLPCPPGPIKVLDEKLMVKLGWKP